MLKNELLRYKIYCFFTCFSRLNGLNKTACVRVCVQASRLVW